MRSVKSTRRAHPRRSVLHRRAQGDADARSRSTERRVDAADADAGRAAVVSSVADRPPRALRRAESGDARRHRQGAERTFVLPSLRAGAAPSPARKLAERGRFSWSPDGRAISLRQRRTADGAAGRRAASARPLASRASRWRSASRCGRRIGSAFAALVADPSVTDPELEPVKAGHVHHRAAVHGPVSSSRPTARRRQPDERVHRSGERSGVESRTARAVLPRRRQQDLRRDRSIAITVADRSSEPSRSGQESFGRLQPTSGGRGRCRRGRDAARPICGCSAPSGSARASPTSTRSSARFTFSKPELFYFHNADGERLGALLYKPAAAGRRRARCRSSPGSTRR